ncbi:MAG: lipoyl synthase [Bacteroidota bacterium]
MSKNNDSFLHNEYIKKPEWLRIKLPDANHYNKVKGVLNDNHLHTICESGSCPNKGECWNAGTATFMILGEICTRNCKFCNVKTGKPMPPDPHEPQSVADAVQKMNIKHCVITSVDRDDLEDGGAGIWAATIKKIKKQNPKTTIEALIPDFKGDESLIQKIVVSGADVISHNLETVKRLTRHVRTFAKYEVSLKVIQYLAQKGVRTKSGIMLGLGEIEEEIFETMDDLLAAGCQIITLGQYLQPTTRHLKVQKYISPEDFKRYGNIARKKGFLFVESAPLVRSSYHAEKHV